METWMHAHVMTGNDGITRVFLVSNHHHKAGAIALDVHHVGTDYAQNEIVAATVADSVCATYDRGEFGTPAVVHRHHANGTVDESPAIGA